MMTKKQRNCSHQYSAKNIKQTKKGLRKKCTLCKVVIIEAPPGSFGRGTVSDNED